ncbi:MAG TPA: alpha/beta fold hydrolase [Kofleriaceae bacterium]|nr:alpha/beta fold hydrolase [Kofleriaceae bacterium]
MKLAPVGVLVLAACGAASSSSKAPQPASPAPAAAAGPRLRERLKPCKLEGSTEAALCGTYAVWENRTTQRGRKIELRIIALPALGPDPAPDAIFWFAGGPGDTATGAAKYLATDSAQLRARHDIVLIDQRGTGGSHPLNCKIPADPGNVQAYFEPTLPVAEVKRCRAELERDADLTQYTTSIAADDFDEVRAWLGYDRIDLEGGSYGTRMAQVYLRRHGAHVRTATLTGVTAMNLYLPLYHARDGKQALDLTLDACVREVACRVAFPTIIDDHNRVMAALERAPGHAKVESPVDHHPVEVTISRDIFAEQIRFALYSAGSASLVPYIVHRAAQGDFQPFARLVMMWEPALRRSLSYGEHLSVTCAEDVPFITQDAIDHAIAGTYLRGFRVNQQVAACREWPRGEIPADFHAPVTSDVPVLLISGNYDPVTPPSWAAQVAPHFKNALHVIVQNGHHGTGGLTNQECIRGIGAAFLESGSTAGLNASCVWLMYRPPFVLNDTTFDAQMTKLAGE